MLQEFGFRRNKMTQPTKSTCNLPDRVRGASMKQFIRPITFSVSALLILGLSACGKSVDNRDVPPDPPTYIEVAKTPEATYFQQTVYDNIFRVHQCKQCHIRGGQLPFADENVDTAFSAAKTKFDPVSGDPSTSDFVIRVSQGHFNWSSDKVADAQELADQLQAWKDALAAGGTDAANTPAAPTPKDILQDPPISDPVAPVTMDPNTVDPNFDAVYTIVTDENQGYCNRCHSSNTTENTPQRPFFAQANADGTTDAATKAIAYSEVVSAGLINLTDPKKSKLVVRPWPQQHNCGSDCQGLSNDILAAITTWSNAAKANNPVFNPDNNLLPSKALTLADGQVTSGGARFDDYVIAKFEFTEGSDDDPTNDNKALDTSGVSPPIELRLYGNVHWVGGFGLQFGAGGQARSISVKQSQKLHDLIVARGEYSLEAWVIPDNTSQQGNDTIQSSVIASYSSGTATRDFTMGQDAYQYKFRNRVVDANGSVLDTDMNENLVQTSLQHVVMTYSQADGRRIYVNGVPKACETDVPGGGDYPTPCPSVDTGEKDNGPLTQWDPGYLLSLGSDTNGRNQWLGKIKFFAIHNKELTEREIKMNYDAGVGQKFNLLFNISDFKNNPSWDPAMSIGDRSYIWFEVAVFDDYSYLFSEPRFIDLDYNKSPKPSVNFAFRGVRIGINGKQGTVGQAFTKLGKSNVPTDPSNIPTNLTAGLKIVNPDPVLLTRLQGEQYGVTPASGTVIPQDLGEKTDQFFLTFEMIGGLIDASTSTGQKLTLNPVYNSDSPAFVVGLRTFDEINASMSALTGVDAASVVADSNGLKGFDSIKSQLPDKESVDTFSSSQQTAIASLAGVYCNKRVEDQNIVSGGKTRAQYFGVNDSVFTSNVATAFSGGSTGANATAIVDNIVKNMVTNVNTLGSGDPSGINTELVSLAAYLLGETHTCDTNLNPTCTGPERTKAIVKAMCTAVLSSAVVTQQ